MAVVRGFKAWRMSAAIVVLSLSSVSPAQFAGGTGEPNDPYQIATPEQLISIGSDPNLLDKHFVLIADLDLDPNLPGGRVFDVAPIAPVNMPPGYSYSVPAGGFAGLFDGNRHAIQNLTLQGDGKDCLGLFGHVASTGRVLRLTLRNGRVTGPARAGTLAGSSSGAVEDCNATGSISGGYGVGGLVGSNLGGTMVRCHATTDVNAVDSFRIGGLVGVNLGTIVDCSAAGTVAGFCAVGGLVGCNGYVACDEYFRQEGTIIRCCATGNITGGFQVGGVGGLVGWNDYGAITDSYAIGDITVGKESGAIGGLVGANGWFSAVVTRCYARGRATAEGPNTWLGGLIGLNDWGGEVQDSFWDMEASGVQTSDGGTGLATAQMQTAATFINAGWDFENIWMICEGRDYPRLRWENVDCGQEAAEVPIP